MDMQIALRQANERVGEGRTYMAAGFLRLHSGERVEDERISHFHVHRDQDIATLTRTPGTVPGRDLHTTELDHQAMGLGSMVTQSIWPAPVSGDHLFLHPRRTLVDPCIDGGEVMAFSGIYVSQSPKAIDCDVVRCFSGPGPILHSEGYSPNAIDLVMATRGSSLESFFALPIWGWGERPVSLRATMHLSILDDLFRYRSSKFGSGPKLDDEERVALEGKLMRLGLANDVKDEQFHRVISILYERRPDLLISSAIPVDSAWQVDMNLAMRDAVHAVMAADEEAPGPVTLAR